METIVQTGAPQTSGRGGSDMDRGRDSPVDQANTWAIEYRSGEECNRRPLALKAGTEELKQNCPGDTCGEQSKSRALKQ